MAAGPTVAVVWDDRFRDYDFGPSHPFRELPRGLAADLVSRWSVEADHPVEWIRSVEPATRVQLGRFHRASYLEQVAIAARSDGLRLLDRGDTPAFPGCDVAAARLVGGTLAALGSVMDDGPRRGFQPGGGLHHAHPDRASGFCIFNDVAVALSEALESHRVGRAAYIDIDVHHGDGVMYGFYNDGRLLDVDFHQDGSTIFPGTGRVTETGGGDGSGRKVNVPLPPGSGDAEFQTVWDRVVPALLAEHAPRLVVLQCGVDGHAGDALGQLRYQARTYDRAITTVMEYVDRDPSRRLIVTGGGGYHTVNVARTLGLVGRRMAGGAPPGASEALPPAWREAFGAAIGAPSPSYWAAVDSGPLPPAPFAETIVSRLEAALGRRFPPVDPLTR